MSKYTQFCNFWRAQAFFKTAAQTSEAGDFLNIFFLKVLKFLRLIFLSKFFLWKKMCILPEGGQKPFWLHKFSIKGELHSNLWNLTFINKLQFPLFYNVLFLKYKKNDNHFWDIYVISYRNMFLYIFLIIRNN